MFFICISYFLLKNSFFYFLLVSFSIFIKNLSMVFLNVSFFFNILFNNNLSVLNFFFLLKYSSFCRLFSLTDLTVSDHLVWRSCLNNVGFSFCLHYFFLSLTFNFSFIIDFFSNRDSLFVSVFNLYKSSCWLEREVFDFFGFYFSDHVDLRRIFTDYGFCGYPFVKDFPVIGFYESSFSESLKFVKSDFFTLTQNLF